MDKIKINIGFDAEREAREITGEDIKYGAKKLTGLSDAVGGVITALYAWPRPVKGIYPRTTNPFNHAIKMISEACKRYLPIGTVQRGREDWMNCASNGPDNEIETQVNYGLEKGLFSQDLMDWWKKVGYINLDNGKFEISDVFTAIGSKTTRQGNSLRAPIVFLENYGIIPRSMLPDDKSMNWSQYHNPKRITPKMWDLAKENRKRLKINYQRILGRKFAKYLGNLMWEIFDSYVDPVDGDFIKRLASNYILLGYGYKILVNENIIETKNIIMMTKKKLSQIYHELLCRKPDALADGYLAFNEDFVRGELGKSKERQQIIRVVNFARKLFLVKGR